MSSTSTNIPSFSPVKLSIPVRAKTSNHQSKPVISVKAVSPSIVKEAKPYQSRCFTTRSGRTTQVPAKVNVYLKCITIPIFQKEKERDVAVVQLPKYILTHAISFQFSSNVHI